MYSKILKNCFYAMCVVIVGLCFGSYAFGAPIAYSDTSIHEYVTVDGYGTSSDYQQDHVVGPGTASITISEIGYYYIEANAIGDVGSFVLQGDCQELTTDFAYADATTYVGQKYTFIAPSSEVIFSYDISYYEIWDESTSDREGWANMNWYIMETGGTSTLASGDYDILATGDITHSFAVTLTEGTEYLLFLSPHLYLSTTLYSGDNTPDQNQIAARLEGSFTLETSENSQQVPEPSSLLFLALGVVGLAGIRKKL